MALFTKSSLATKAQQTSPYVTEDYVRNFSANSLGTFAKAAALNESFDIFLSHSREDAILIKGLRDELLELGFSVYVDWIEDPQLDRSHVTKHTAAVLRGRMRQCKCLLFATSSTERKSLWMPWELGYMDAYRGSRVAVAPMVDDADAGAQFNGQEYLGLYPYLDKTGTSLWVHRDSSTYVRFKEWLVGANP